MNAERLLNYYERIIEAPTAVAHLRRFIVDLAIRGKLVLQDPNDTPASELLTQIAEEQILLSIDKVMKRRKSSSPSRDETPFALPQSWQWSRLGYITSYIQRGKSPEYASSGGFPVVSQKCVQWSGLDLTVAKRVTTDSLEKYDQVRMIRHNDLLWNSTGTGTIGRIIRVTNPPSGLICDTHVTVVRCLRVDPEFIRIWLRSNSVYGQIENQASGSTNQIELTAQMAVNQVVPLPPVAEQHRIVQVVEGLMALCDQLEATRVRRDVVRDQLMNALLAEALELTV